MLCLCLSIGLKYSNCVPIKISVLVTMLENGLRQVLKVRRATNQIPGKLV